MNGYKLRSQLSGHSGCKIYLMEDDNRRPIVRKYSRDVEYNARLKSQCAKQEAFHDSMLRTPRVLSKGTDADGLFYFDMDYVHGITLAEYIRKIDVSEIRDIVGALTARSEYFIRQGVPDNSEAFHRKLAELNSKLSPTSDPTSEAPRGWDRTLVRRALERLSECDWKNFPLTFCHGDLTLENIIVCQGKFYLIDFLDSFYDCFILDVAALIQDAQCLWYYRAEERLDVNVKIRLMVLRDLLLEKMSQLGVSRQEVYSALLLKLIRIYPYAHDERTIKFLNANVERLLEVIDSCQH